MELPKADWRNEYEKQLRFETLLADISARFINLPSDQINSVIEEAQCCICGCLGIDISVLWQWSEESPRFLTVTHLYSPPDGPSRPERIVAEESFPWTLNKLLQRETLVLSTEDMPPEAAHDQETRRHYGIKSTVALPLTVGGGPLIGVLSFDTLREEREWPDELVKRLQLVAQIFCNALVRKESDRTLRESEVRLSLAADSAAIGLWELNCNTNLFWATERARAIFGYDHGENITMERFEQSVYADDLARVRQLIKQSLESSEPLNVEYRIHTGDGGMKWIYSNGRPYFKSDGEPDRLLGVSVDITDKKAFEQRILESEARLASTMDVADLGFYEMNEDNRVTFLDDRIRSILGITPEYEKEGRDFWLTHIHPKDLSHILEQSRQVLENGVDKFTIDYRYMHPEQGLIWLHHLSRVMTRNVDGGVTRVIGIMQDITGRMKMEEELRAREACLKDSQKDLQQMAGRMISVKEQELRRLSRELHDDLTQRLAVLAIEAGKLELKLGESKVSLHESIMISRVKDGLIKISEDVHRISRQLHPTILDDLGLIRAIESECAAFGQRENIEIIFTKEDVPDRFPEDVSLCVYRIVQEGLKNIINHSGVKRCEIRLRGADETIRLAVKDEGVGFDPVEVRKKPGLGLASMRERVQLVKGDFSIDTKPGKGTMIQVSIPLKGEDGHDATTRTSC